MREFNRRRAAAARSRRATPEDLREASQRYKEIQEELRQLDLAPETRHGEERLDRYERELRLRSMREDFQATVETPLPQPRNSAMLALVMTVASFLLCSFCFGGTYFALQYFTQAPSAQSTASDFWTTMENSDYNAVQSTYLSQALRVSQSADQFAQLAAAADKQYGRVTAATFVSQSSTSTTQTALTYTVVRTAANGKQTMYPVVLTMTLRQNAWTIGDYGNLFQPSATSRIVSPALALSQPLMA